MLSFKGNVTPELMQSILNIMERKLERIEPTSKLRKKVFNILVECLQNLYHHSNTSALDTTDNGSVVVLIGKNVRGYSIMTGNVIGKTNAAALQGKLEEINQLTQEELKALYKQVLNNGQRSSKGGGGLGIIDIARKSGEKLEYGFLPFGNSRSFFSLNVKVSN